MLFNMLFNHNVPHFFCVASVSSYLYLFILIFKFNFYTFFPKKAANRNEEKFRIFFFGLFFLLCILFLKFMLIYTIIGVFNFNCSFCYVIAFSCKIGIYEFIYTCFVVFHIIFCKDFCFVISFFSYFCLKCKLLV